MRFTSIHIKEGLFERTINFSKFNNLIYSKHNSKGKTTLLRMLLYGLGYSIPNTKNIKFDRCEVDLIIECDALSTVKLSRYNLSEIQVKNQKINQTYVLPEQHNELLSSLWGTNNADILNNLLGAFYVDQEKGWTLLNRGTVIGKIRFNIEELIRGISGIDCSELLLQEKSIQSQIEKYSQMYSVAQYKEKINEDMGTVSSDDYETEINSQLDQLIMKKRMYQAELKRIDGILLENKKFKDFVLNMKLIIQPPIGDSFPLKEENILGLNDSIDLLVAKRSLVATSVSKISRKIETLQENRIHEVQQLTFYKTASQLDIFDRDVARMSLNPISVKRKLDALKLQLHQVREKISEVTKNGNVVASEISNNIIKYSTALNLGDKTSISNSYLFTSNLKELSGAILHKTAFAFRLAYILAIEKILSVKLPIILDSPSGKEVDPSNINLMMDILKKDFSDHQIIIASIFKYDLPELNTIEIKNKLIE